MNSQVDYYNNFGKQFQQSILDCPEPSLWTTDYQQKGRVYQEIKKRIDKQRSLILAHFSKEFPVLDIGCGFGRQAFLLAQQGFTVTGTDTSDVFLEIARKLFDKHGYKGDFYNPDIQKKNNSGVRYRQLLLLDVVEHVPPFRRRSFFESIYKRADPGAIFIVSLPNVKKRISSQLNNSIRRAITQHLSYFIAREEHPYPIPGKKTLRALSKNLFEIITIEESAETVYYVLKRT